MDYQGCYPHRMIRRAQDTLAYIIRNSNNRFVKQVRFKCGVNPNSCKGSQSQSQSTPTPPNNLWHEDALKYKYTFPWSEGRNAAAGHNNDKNSYISRNSTSQQIDAPVIPRGQTTQILHDNLWCNDALGTTGYVDFTDSTTSGSSTSSKKCRATRVSKDSSCDYITVSDTEQQVDLTNDSEEPSVEEEPIARKRANKKSKRKYPNNESAEMCPIDTEGSGPSVSKKLHIEFGKGLACDYCGYVASYELYSEAVEVMKNHFLDQKHNSASLAKIQWSGGKKGKAVTILKESVLVTSPEKHVALVNEVVPMCPWNSCNKIHNTIWACAKHFEMSHSRHISNCYGLANVAVLKTILFPASNTCKTCNISFACASALHKHWKKTQHFTCYLPSQEEQVALYFCPYCNQLHYNFSGCRTHIMLRHKDHGDASMHVVFIDPTTDSLELLPIEPRPAEAQASCEMAVLENMNKCAKVYGITKKSKKKIKAEKNRWKQNYIHQAADITYGAFKRRTTV